MRRFVAFGRLALLAALAIAPAAFAEAPKIGNARGAAADTGLFLRASFEKPAPGVCEVVSPDPNYVNEMLVRFGEGGTKSYERRVALVIGNEDYRAIGKLKNPANDATSMARMFRALGFTVYRSIDATTAGLNDCFARFKADLEGKPADIALFFYAGHGVQLTSQADGEKRNYMLSVDAAVDAHGKATGFKQIDAVLNEMRAHSSQAVFLYDACRNSPLAEGTVKEADGQAVRQFSFAGAAAINANESDAASAAGLFIAYATSPNKTADDAWGQAGSTHSPFTEALLKHLPTPGVLIEEALANAYYEVGEKTGGNQTPWTSSSLQDALRLNGSMKLGESQTTIAGRVRLAAAVSEYGLKLDAVMSALKSMPSIWPSANAQSPYGQAMAELYRAMHREDVRLADGARPDLMESSIAEFSPDGSKAITGHSDNKARVWDARTGRLLHTLSGHKNVIWQARIIDSGKFAVTSSDDDRTIVWNVESGTLVHTFEGGRRSDVSGDGKRIATGGADGTVRVWELATGRLLHSFKTAQVKDRLGPFEAAAPKEIEEIFFRPGSPDRIVTMSGMQVLAEKTIARLWDAKSGALVRAFDGHELHTWALAVSPDGKYVATADLDTVILWNAETGGKLQTLQSEKHKRAGPRQLAFSDDSYYFIVRYEDHSARIWYVDAQGADGDLVAELRAHHDQINDVALKSDSVGVFALTASRDGTAKYWNDSGDVLRDLIGHTGWVISTRFSADGRRAITSSSDGTAKIWALSLGPQRDIDTGTLRNLVISRDGSMVAGTRPMTVTDREPQDALRIWDVASGNEMRVIDHPDHVMSAGFSADGKRIVTGSWDGGARVWNTSSGKQIGKLLPHQRLRAEKLIADPVYNVELSPDGKRLLTGTEYGNVLLWDLATAQSTIIYSGQGSKSFVADLEFSPDGRKFLLAVDDRIEIWDAESIKIERTLDFEGVNKASFSRDGAYVIGGGFKDSRLWDAQTGDVVAAFDPAHGAAVSPDGQRVLTWSDSDFRNPVKLWDARTGVFLRGFDTKAGAHSAVFGVRDQTILAAPSGDTQVWDIGLYGPGLLEAAYDLLTDDLRAEVERERIRYWEVDPALLQ